MTPEILASSAAIVLSLLFSYIPGFRAWFEPKSPDSKRLIMLALLLLVSAGSFTLACAPAFGLLGNGVAVEPAAASPASITCDLPGAWSLFKVFLAALIANQAAFLISPRRQ